MEGWQNNIALSEYAFDALVIVVTFAVAFAIRRRSALLRRYLIPTSLVAGFIGLLVGPAILDWVPFKTGRMGFYVYHLLALTFITVGLRKPRTRATAAAFHVGFVKTVTVILQGLIGLAILYAFHAFVDRTISPAVGMLLPLGFGMGPGIALSIGASWEGYGVAGASDAGLAIATLGFVMAYGVGVWSVNRGVRDGVVEIVDIEDAVATDAPLPEARSRGAALLPTLTFLVASVFIVYAITFAAMKIASGGMQKIGLAAEIPVLWSLNFLWANLIAMAFRRAVSLVRSDVFAHPILDRAVAVLADVLVAAAVMAIGLTLAPAYFVPLLLICLIGGTVTYFVVKKTVHWAFTDHVFTRFAGLFGEQTGTVSSGLALIRIVDPGYVTPVAQDQVLGSGTALVLGFPLLLLINLPLTRFGGSGTGYAIVAGLLSVYLLVAIVGWRFMRARVR